MNRKIARTMTWCLAASVFWMGSSSAAHADWNQFQLAGPGSATSASHMTAVSRIPTSLEV
jgi:hypothetical protein